MKYLERVLFYLMWFFALCFVARVAWLYLDWIQPHEVRYDCRALHGGWHPDVPIEVQQKCRELK